MLTTRERDRGVLLAIGFILILALSACSSVESADSMDLESVSDIDMETYLLAVGMDHAEESIQALSEFVESIRAYGYEYEGQAVSAMCQGEMVNALLVPH